VRAARGFSFSDIGHAVLDVAGLVPVVGEVADVANGIWYAAEGNYVDAALSFASAIPLAGYGASAAKAVRYGDKAVDAARTVARQDDNIADAGRAITRTGDDVADVYSLTVEGLHAYYVEAGDADILVHNTQPDFCPIHDNLGSRRGNSASI